MGAEKRREHRFNAHLPVTVASGSSKFSGRTDNISRLGCLCEVNRQIPEGSHVAVEIELPECPGEPSLRGLLRAGGSVFRCHQLGAFQEHALYGVGIFFTRFEQEPDKERLSRYIDYLATREDQQVREAFKRRKEKEEAERGAAAADEFFLKQAEFQRESLTLLKQIHARLEAIYRLLPPDEKK